MPCVSYFCCSVAVVPVSAAAVEALGSADACVDERCSSMGAAEQQPVGTQTLCKLVLWMDTMLWTWHHAQPLEKALYCCLVSAGYVSDVANGGQILIDDRTFRLIKHSLSALGTVDENGFNDKQLQQLLQAQVVARLQRHVACGVGCCRYVTGIATRLVSSKAHRRRFTCRPVLQQHVDPTCLPADVAP